MKNQILCICLILLSSFGLMAEENSSEKVMTTTVASISAAIKASEQVDAIGRNLEDLLVKIKKENPKRGDPLWEELSRLAKEFVSANEKYIELSQKADAAVAEINKHSSVSETRMAKSRERAMKDLESSKASSQRVYGSPPPPLP